MAGDRRSKKNKRARGLWKAPKADKGRYVYGKGQAVKKNKMARGLWQAPKADMFCMAWDGLWANVNMV